MLLFSMQVTQISSLEKAGIVELWDSMKDYQNKTFSNGELLLKRERQLKLWFRNHIRDNIMCHFEHHPQVKTLLPEMEELVVRRHVSPGLAADFMLEQFIK